MIEVISYLFFGKIILIKINLLIFIETFSGF